MAVIIVWNRRVC